MNSPKPWKRYLVAMGLVLAAAVIVVQRSLETARAPPAPATSTAVDALPATSAQPPSAAVRPPPTPGSSAPAPDVAPAFSPPPEPEFRVALPELLRRAERRDPAVLAFLLHRFAECTDLIRVGVGVQELVQREIFSTPEKRAAWRNALRSEQGDQNGPIVDVTEDQMDAESRRQIALHLTCSTLRVDFAAQRVHWAEVAIAQYDIAILHLLADDSVRFDRADGRRYAQPLERIARRFNTQLERWVASGAPEALTAAGTAWRNGVWLPAEPAMAYAYLYAQGLLEPERTQESLLALLDEQLDPPQRAAARARAEAILRSCCRR